MCALSSVARLSVSMTMSMSSGLFSMVEDDSDKDKDDSSKDSHHHSNKDQQSLNADGSTPYGSSRRHSAPKVLTPGANMSDIEEESVTSGHSAWNTCRQWRHFLIPVRHWYTGQARHTAMVHIRVLWSWCIKASKPTNVAHRNSCHGKRFKLMAESEWMLKWSTF